MLSELWAITLMTLVEVSKDILLALLKEDITDEQLTKVVEVSVVLAADLIRKCKLLEESHGRSNLQGQITLPK